MNTIKAILLIIIGFTAMHAQAQLTAAKCFADAPDDILPMLARNTRLDMLDYYRAGSDRQSTNIFGGNSRILAIDSVAGGSSLTFEGGSGIRAQIFVLNADSPDPLIGIIETVDTPMPDSSLRIYDKNWQCVGSLLLPAGKGIAVPAPKLADWLIRPADSDNVAGHLPFVMATYAYDPASRTLSVKHSMDAYFEPSEGAKVLDKIKSQLTYAWDGRQFKPKKK